jgi:SAM-dependent methyltransferase
MLLSRVLKGPLRPIARSIEMLTFRLSNRSAPRFRCPICRYEGPFKVAGQNAGVRQHAECPACGALERHRLQVLVLEALSSTLNFSAMEGLHVAPEACLKNYLRPRLKRYTTSDLAMSGVDVQADLCRLPFGDGAFDLIFASHVLEHIEDDNAAIAEIARVLRSGGVAILPVPIISPDKTVEYPGPNAHEDGHVRAPGLDYFERFAPRFASVRTYSSHDFDPAYQTFIYEERSAWPRDRMPLRPTSPGPKHVEYVPVCVKS